MKTFSDGRIIIEGARDLKPTPQSVGSTIYNKTGVWRNIEPFYANITPPCNGKCLAGEDIVMQLSLVKKGKFLDALDLIRKANPFPAICGRVCPHPCEENCSRTNFGGALKIHIIERFLGDFAIKNKIRCKPLGSKHKRVAIIGAGPAGLSCAFFLGVNGYNNTVFEASNTIGGLLRRGIPEYRLPRDVLDEEMQILDELPIDFEFDRRLGANLGFSDLEKFDAVFIAIGKGASRKLGIETEECSMIYSGIDFLKNIHMGYRPLIGKKVAVIGGGNTAFDCARTLLRLGSKPIILYRRSTKEMPAFPNDIKEAKEEGIEILTLTAPTKVFVEKGYLKKIEFVKMQLGEPDGSGRRKPIPIVGSEFIEDFDTLIEATGELLDEASLSNLQSLKISEGYIKIDKNYSTSLPRIFAGGDCVNSIGTVAAAIQDGRLGARAIDCFLSGSSNIADNLTLDRGAKNTVFTAEQLNPAYFESVDAISLKQRSSNIRKKDFGEINSGASEKEIIYEANRCISCGTCSKCDICWLFCGDNAIKKYPDKNYEIDYTYCKGCGICAKECPRGVINMRTATK